MKTKQPSGNTEQDATALSPAAVEAFDIALVTSTLVALVFTYGFIKWTSFHSLTALIAIIGADAIFVFLIVPHVTAYWLDCDIDTLLTSNAPYRL